MTYKEHISETLFRAYCSFGSAKSGASRSRYKSWEYCHIIFLQMHKKGYKALSEEDFDYLALNLAFFLASWGMYRGSSFLLQRDYKTHIPAVRIIMEDKYGPLWDFDPSIDDANKAKELLFENLDNVNGLFFRLKDCYSINKSIEEDSVESALVNLEEDESEKKKVYTENSPSDTLITKILLATLACIPAFDTFFKKSCGTVEPKINIKPEIAFLDLCDFAKKYAWELQFKCKDAHHPPMKVLDLYFWRVGLGLSLVSSLNDESKHNVQETLINEKYFDEKNELSNSKEAREIIAFPEGTKWKGE